MSKTDPNQAKFHFDRKNYFIRFTTENEPNVNIDTDETQLKRTDQPISRSVRHALEYFVNDLRLDRNTTVDRFLHEANVDDVLRAIAQFLLSNDDRICGNSAYILGSAVEVESGLKRFLTVFANHRLSNTTTVNIVRILCQLLIHSDSECVLNAAGTLGTICGAKDGRDLILQHTCIAQLVANTSSLLSSSNSWIASNAALVLARITVEEVGCQTILTHSKHRDILSQLMRALDINDPSRATNAAFAIGRLIEGNEGKKILIAACGQEPLFNALLSMLEAHEEKGVNKNACYALSCLCTTQYGFEICLQSISIFHRILLAIEATLSSTEHETVWFALMCLRTIAQYNGASAHLSHSNRLATKLRDIRDKWGKFSDIQDEAKALWYIIHRNVKPTQVRVDECRTTSAEISWSLSVNSWNDNELQFRILLNDQSVGLTQEKSFALTDLKSSTSYNVQIQYVTPFGDSLCSAATIFRTLDELPPPVSNLHVVRTSMIAVRVAWDPPHFEACDSLKGYQIYLNNVEYECVSECNATVNSLTASTTYQIDVCAVNGKGKGLRTSIDVVTDSAGDSLPAAPTFFSIARREILVKWQPPETIHGRLNRYQLVCNGKTIYSGTDQECRATELKPDKEYSMHVIVFTSEGQFRSRTTKARTLKDEFNGSHRNSLYETPPPNPAQLKRAKTVHVAQMSRTSHNIPKAPSRPVKAAREAVSLPNHSVDITTLHALQIKSERNSHHVTSSGPRKVNLVRSNTTAGAVVFRQPKTDATPNSPQRLSASVVVPSFDYNREASVRWATPVTPHGTHSKPYRLSMIPNPPTISAGSAGIPRCSSTSLPDLWINSQ